MRLEENVKNIRLLISKIKKKKKAKNCLGGHTDVSVPEQLVPEDPFETSESSQTRLDLETPITSEPTLTF